MYKIRVLKVSHPDLPWDWFTPVLYKGDKVHRVCGHAFGFDGGMSMQWSGACKSGNTCSTKPMASPLRGWGFSLCAGFRGVCVSAVV